MKKILTLMILALVFAPTAKAQDVHFSQFFEAPQSVNPALTGHFVGDHRFIANYKDQWRPLGSPYKTYAFSYDMGFNKIAAETGYLALGVMVFNDNAGDLSLSTTQLNLNIAYHLKITDNQTVGAAIGGGFGQKSIDITNAQWDNQYDILTGGHNPAFSSNETNPFNTFTYPDLGFGLHYSIRGAETNMASNDGFRANFGVGVHHFNSPRLRFYSASEETRLSPRIAVHGQSLIGIRNTNLAIAPGFFYYNQGKMREFYFGSSFRYTLTERSRYTGFMSNAFFSLGGYYRLADAAVIFAQLEFNDIAIGVSYDVNVSKLRVATIGRGGIELSIRYIIKQATQKSFH